MRSAAAATPMVGPERELLEPLLGIERVAYRVGDVFARRLKPAAALWNLSFTAGLAWLCLGRRLDVIGAENIGHLNSSSRVLVVANHRSFFDFFVISAATMWTGRMPRSRTFFPVRSSFFYEKPAGILVNALMSGMSMFPPIFRDRAKQPFNRYSLERCIAELSIPGTVVGVHPEGTRNKGEDPYELLPAKAGMGKIALGVDDGVEIVPVFVLGMGNDLRRELELNWARGDRERINVVIGPPVDLRDLRSRRGHRGSKTLHQQAAQRCLDAIAALAEIERRLRSDAPPAAPVECPPRRASAG
jgi:1-acyl-sn-glycerol-3-phosphate acyltransferase